MSPQSHEFVSCQLKVSSEKVFFLFLKNQNIRIYGYLPIDMKMSSKVEYVVSLQDSS